MIDQCPADTRCARTGQWWANVADVGPPLTRSCGEFRVVHRWRSSRWPEGSPLHMPRWPVKDPLMTRLQNRVLTVNVTHCANIGSVLIQRLGRLPALGRFVPGSRRDPYSSCADHCFELVTSPIFISMPPSAVLVSCKLHGNCTKNRLQWISRR